jgi:hypothetical protein
MVFGALGLVVSCDFALLCGTMIQEPKGVTCFWEVELMDLCIETKGIMLFLAAIYQLDAKDVPTFQKHQADQSIFSVLFKSDLKIPEISIDFQH